jgi:hypothetical protein
MPPTNRLATGGCSRSSTVWRLIAIASSRPGYYEEIEAVRNGTARTVPAEEVIPGWQRRLAVARRG